MGYYGASAGELSSYSPVTQVSMPHGPRGPGQHQYQVDVPAYQVAPSTKARRQQRIPEDGACATDDHLHHYHQRSIPAAVAMDGSISSRGSVGMATAAAPRTPEPQRTAGVDPRDVLLVDLGSRSLIGEDLEKALRLWTRPAILIAGRNLLDGLPANIPGTILYLDLSWNR